MTHFLVLLSLSGWLTGLNTGSNVDLRDFNIMSDTGNSLSDIQAHKTQWIVKPVMSDLFSFWSFTKILSVVNSSSDFCTEFVREFNIGYLIDLRKEFRLKIQYKYV